VDKSSQNQNTEATLHCHESTKHSEESVRVNVHFVDWENKPLPFKIHRRVELCKNGLSQVIHQGTIRLQRAMQILAICGVSEVQIMRAKKRPASD